MVTEGRYGDTFRHHPVAVIYQSSVPPPIDGLFKPLKPGGYSDSGADIAYALHAAGIPLVTPTSHPNPAVDLDWVFSDTIAGIDIARRRSARVIWANTVLYSGHPVERVRDRQFRIVGQSPSAAQTHDDKWFTNRLLRQSGCAVAAAILAGEGAPGSEGVALGGLTEAILDHHGLVLPVVVKPVRGRGSEGVAKVDTLDELKQHADGLIRATATLQGCVYPKYGRLVMVEEYLSGTELTLTIMPPGSYSIQGREAHLSQHWSLPAVRRFNHREGVAPYSGEVAVSKNSELITPQANGSPAIDGLIQQCCLAGLLVNAAAPIRIDCRQSRDGDYRIFDLNMKPNMTGPGRPGRDQQESLTCMAAQGIGWTYRDLVVNMLRQAWVADSLT